MNDEILLLLGELTYILCVKFWAPFFPAQSMSQFWDSALILDISFLFEVALCSADSISSHTVADIIMNYFKDSANSVIANIMFGSKNNMDYQISIKDNKLYFGGKLYFTS